MLSQILQVRSVFSACLSLAVCFNPDLPFPWLVGFTPRELDISDEENSSPVPTERDGSDRYFLYLATAWLLALVVVTCALRTSQAAALMQRYRAMLLARALAPAD